MAGLTWGEMATMFLESVGDTAASQREKWIHLTEGYRRVASQLDIPELTQPDAQVTIDENPSSAGTYLDYVEVDCDLSAIRSIFNVTAGHPIKIEDGDGHGRDRYLLAGALPPEGEVTKAVRMGNRIYVRDRPKVETTLKFIFKVQVPDLDDSFEAKHPLIPAQYQMSIVHKARESYYALHPDRNEGGFISGAAAREAGAQAHAILATTEDPKGYEDRAKRGRFRMRGVRFSPRSFR